MHPARRFVKNEYSVYYGPMPKVSDAHRESRREQILVAAWKCFSRNGFHSTSMADVIREAGLSAGAVYLYFRSKDDIIVAVATQVFGGIQGRLLQFAEQEPPPSPAEIATFLVRQPVLAREQAPADLFPLLLAVWSEATRNPALTEVAESILSGLRTLLTGMLEPMGRGRRRTADAPGGADPGIPVPGAGIRGAAGALQCAQAGRLHNRGRRLVHRGRAGRRGPSQQARATALSSAGSSRAIASARSKPLPRE